MAYEYQRRNDPVVTVLAIMLPLFFLFGWVANDYIHTGNQTNTPQVGVGGGPGGPTVSIPASRDITPPTVATPTLSITPASFNPSISPDFNQ